MSTDNYKQLLTELGENVGLPDLAPDEDKYCCLGFDDKIVVHFQYNDENEVMMLFAQIGVIDEDKQNDVYPRLLKANLFWQGTGGATLGVDDESREVLLAYQTSVESMNFPKFQELLEGFINTSELWIDTLSAIQKGEEAPAQKGESKKAETPPPPEPGGGFPGIRA